MAGTALCMAFNLCYVITLLLQMMADIMQVMDIIKCGIYSFYVRQNLTVGFLRHWGSGVPRNIVRGVQQIRLKTEDRENGDLVAVAP
jgi:hypothetical protein